MRQVILHGGAAALCLGLAGCDVSVPYVSPTFPFFNGYAQTAPGAPVLLSNSDWWTRLNDPALDRLVSVALRDNLSLELARERVIAARAERNTVPGSTVLSTNAQVGADGTVHATTAANGTDIVGSVELGLSWMLDPYGARREELRAADAAIGVADAERDAAQLLVLYNMANAYVDLRYRQRILAITRQELSRRTDTLALTRSLEQAESATRLEVTRSRARVAEIRADLPAIEAQISTSLNEIAVLAGAAPGALPPDLMAALENGGALPHPDLSPQVGIPADLLRNRPDIAIAERRYAAAIARIGVARADMYPRLSLTGGITLNALDRSGAGVDYFFGPLVQFPSLPMGTTSATVEARHSEARQAHTAWKSTVLTAILEVETSLVNYNASSVAAQSADEAARLYAEALSLTRVVYENDEATLGDLIDAEEEVSVSQRAVLDLARSTALGFIDLNVRLGAGHATGAASGVASGAETGGQPQTQ